MLILTNPRTIALHFQHRHWVIAPNIHSNWYFRQEQMFFSVKMKSLCLSEVLNIFGTDKKIWVKSRNKIEKFGQNCNEQEILINIV